MTKELAKTIAIIILTPLALIGAATVFYCIAMGNNFKYYHEVMG